MHIYILENLFTRAFLKANEAQEEVVPPKLNLTPQQLFWVGYAQDYCLLGGMFEYFDTFEDVLNFYWVDSLKI